MKILTHNSLKCPVKNVNVGYPMLLEIADMEIIETECNREFIAHLMPSLDWGGVLIAAKAIGLENMPESYSDSLLTDDSFLLAMHNLLLDVNVIAGEVICPETGRRFPIVNGMLDMR